MRSRYFGPARPITNEKDWLQDSYNADSYSRDQSKLPAIYLRPVYVYPTPEPTPEPTPIYYFYNYIDAQGYPYDLGTGKEYVDLELNPIEEFYDLSWPFSYIYIHQQGYPYDLETGRSEVDMEGASTSTQETITYELHG